MGGGRARNSPPLEAAVLFANVVSPAMVTLPASNNIAPAFSKEEITVVTSCLDL